MNFRHQAFTWEIQEVMLASKLAQAQWMHMIFFVEQKPLSSVSGHPIRAKSSALINHHCVEWLNFFYISDHKAPHFLT